MHYTYFRINKIKTLRISHSCQRLNCFFFLLHAPEKDISCHIHRRLSPDLYCYLGISHFPHFFFFNFINTNKGIMAYINKNTSSFISRFYSTQNLSVKWLTHFLATGERNVFSFIFNLCNIQWRARSYWPTPPSPKRPWTTRSHDECHFLQDCVNDSGLS